MTVTQRTGHLDQPSASTGGPSGGAVLRSLLWLVLVASTAGNTVASVVGAGLPVHLGFGVLTFACAVTLIVGFLRRRS